MVSYWILEMAHGVSSPHGIVDEAEAHIGIEFFSIRISAIYEQPHGGQTACLRPLDRFFKQSGGDALPVICGQYGETVEIEFSRLCLFVHIREVSLQESLCFFDECFPQRQEVGTVIRDENTCKNLVFCERHQRVFVTVLRIFPLNERGHHAFEISQRVVGTGKPPAAIFTHR